jgi:hypothetical protein
MLHISQMHPYKTITQTLLVLSILNPVFAAPIPRHAYSLRTEGSAPLQDPAPSSGSPPLSATDGQVHQIREASTLSPTTEESSSTHTLSSTVTAEGSTTEPHTAVTHDMLATQPRAVQGYLEPNLKVFGGFVLSMAALVALVKISNPEPQKNT